MKSLAIIGGGIHGSMLFVNLPKNIRRNTVIIDTHTTPLARFISQCKAVGVPYLRSPGSHSLHRDFRHLFKYARANGFGASHFWGPYATPSLPVFSAHAHALLEECKVQNHWLQACVVALRYQEDAWHIECKNPSTHLQHTVSARRVILAMGQDDASVPAAFAAELEPQNHVLHESFVAPKNNTKVCVIGGGMSGTQCALRLVKTKNHDVTLICPQPHTVTNFDSNPCFIGPRCQPSFLRLSSYEERAALLKKHRYPGSINPALLKECENIQNNPALAKRFSIVYGRVATVRMLRQQAYKGTGACEKKYELTLSNNKQFLYDAVICASGLNTRAPENSSSANLTRIIAPHQEIVQSLIRNYKLPHAMGNFPIVSPNLEWHTNLFVSGALAELEVGMAARNIIGAHLTYRRLKHVWNTWS